MWRGTALPRQVLDWEHDKFFGYVRKNPPRAPSKEGRFHWPLPIFTTGAHVLIPSCLSVPIVILLAYQILKCANFIHLCVSSPVCFRLLRE